MAIIHFILQGKGGVGKSLIASSLYQYLAGKDLEVIGIDTDPNNATFAGYKEFNVKELNILNGDDIDPRCFDEIIEIAMELPEEAHLIIDNGASSFFALSSYLKETEAMELLQGEGQKIMLHSVITGGQAISDTVKGLKSLAVNFPKAPLIVWLNLYFGDIVMDEKNFTDFKVYQDHYEQFQAIIEIPNKRKETFGKDLEDLFAKQHSFKTAINSSLNIITKQRLKIFWTEFVDVIDKANLV